MYLTECWALVNLSDSRITVTVYRVLYMKTRNLHSNSSSRLSDTHKLLQHFSHVASSLPFRQRRVHQNDSSPTNTLATDSEISLCRTMRLYPFTL